MNKTNKIWEYDWVPMNVGNTGDSLLKKKGLEGWEAYGIIESSHTDVPSAYRVFVKREIEAE